MSKEVCKRCVLIKDLKACEVQLHEVRYEIDIALDDDLPDLEQTELELLDEMFHLTKVLENNLAEEFGDEH